MLVLYIYDVEKTATSFIMQYALISAFIRSDGVIKQQHLDFKDLINLDKTLGPIHSASHY